MHILNVQQGGTEWLSIRARHFTASECSAMLGLSKYQTRNDLLNQKSTGIIPDIDPGTQARFDKGHTAESAARPLAEAIIGQDLYPITATLEVEGLSLLASFDGVSMDEEIIFEHKLFNKSLANSIEDAKTLGPHRIDPHYRFQMDQQLLVSGAKKCLFMTSDGTEANMSWCWYEPNPDAVDEIVAGWAQFAKDLAAYVPTEIIPSAVAAPIMDLPAIIITATGSLAVETNFSRWGMELKDFIARIPAKPSTDQEFADCKAALAALKKAEAQLDSEESRVLSMVPSIDDMKREKKLLRDLSSVTRLALEKLVVQRETAVKVEIMQAGKDAIAEHIAGLNKRLEQVQLPPIVADFAAAIKSKRNLENMRGAVSDLVAEKKIESNALADKIQINLKTIDQVDVAYRPLFADFAALVMKAPDDLALVIKSRIETEDKRRIEDRGRILEAEREKMRQEETDKAEVKVRAEQEAKAKEEAMPAVDQAHSAPASNPAPAPAKLAEVQKSASAPATQRQTRPTDAKIIGVLAVHFSVSEQTVRAWLADFGKQQEAA